jgi:ArsR family transcriptional regulator, arsenate/arsenite/antimonite-responsive transcriptional repressor
MNDYQARAKQFKAFCDENRLKIIELLQNGEKCACELIDCLDMGQSTLSYHMKVLCESGIVINRQEGKWAHYRISAEGSANAIAFLHALTTPRGGTAACCSSCECGDA